MTRWDTVQVDGSAMRCYLSTPEGAGPFPGVVVIQHVSGVDSFIQTMTDRLAAAGFVGIAPELYHREDPNATDDAMTRMGRLRDANIVQDVRAAIEHLSSVPEALADRIGITGFCMGGRVAYLIATHNPGLRAAVVFYGGNIMALGRRPSAVRPDGAHRVPGAGPLRRRRRQPEPGGRGEAGQ